MEKQEIRKALVEAEFARKKLLQPYFLDLGLTLGQGQPRILRTLKQKGAMTQRELADLCKMDVTNMSRTLDRLEENGLIQRTRPKNSRRANLVELTDQGHEKAGKVVECFERLDERICQDFTEEELCQLLGYLQRIIKNLQAESGISY